MAEKATTGAAPARGLASAAVTLLLLLTGSLIRAAEVVEYYHLDAIGNVRAVTNAAGQVVERHDYLPFGEECTTGPCAANLALGSGQPRKFTGKERDAETGLDYFGARYYGSKIGRFTTVDPVYTWQENLVDPQRWNRYAYARNNPLRYVDPDGKHPILVVALVMAAAFVLNNPTNANVTQGPTQDTIVPNSLLVAAGYGFAAGGARAAGREIFEETVENVTGLPVGGLPAKPSEAYDRLKHYGRTPTKADRRVLGAQADEVLDHDPPLVKRYYEGDPSCCEPPGYQMTAAERRGSASDRGRMNRQPKTESNRQGGEMSRYSQEKKREISQ
jgi:RHS repeat-associated protein